MTRQAPVLELMPGAPRGPELAYVDGSKQAMIRNVVAPTLTAFLPERAKANGTSVIVCPGGGFRFLSWENEGLAVARWLQARGIAAFVLKYRLVDTGPDDASLQKQVGVLMGEIARVTQRPDSSFLSGADPGTAASVALAIADGRQAVKLVRRRAAEWGLDPARVGILGFSAGAVVAAQAALSRDPQERPAFAAPIYGPPLGKIDVPGDAPPLFLLCAADDPIAAGSAPLLYADWKRAGRSVELHVFSRGGHGFGMGRQSLPSDRWIERFADWLETLR